MNHTFTLNPAYKDFEPGVSKLEFTTIGLSGCMVAFVSLANLVYLAVILLTVFCIDFLTRPDELFRTQGVETTGQIVGCEMVTIKSSSMVPKLMYTYSWNDTSFQDYQTVYDYDHDCTPYLNHAVTVLLVSSDPGLSRLITTESSVTPTSDIFKPMGIFIIAFLVINLAFGAITLVHYYRAKRIYPLLVNEGRLLTGEITKISGTTVKGGNFMVSVKYQFQSPDGELLKGSGGMHRQDLKEALPAVGTPVSILYADRKAYVML